MFSRHHRKARFLFALSDVLLTALAFEAAYQTRLWLGMRLPQFEREFFITVPTKALLLISSVLASVVVGYWLEVYDRLDSGNPRVILRDTLRQCASSFVCLVLVEYLLRLDLSRPFLLLYIGYAFLFLTLFRWKAGSLVGIIRREFGAPHYVMVVGTSERARKLARLLEGSENYGVKLTGFLADTPNGAPHRFRCGNCARGRRCSSADRQNWS